MFNSERTGLMTRDEAIAVYRLCREMGRPETDLLYRLAMTLCWQHGETDTEPFTTIKEEDER